MIVHTLQFKDNERGVREGSVIKVSRILWMGYKKMTYFSYFSPRLASTTWKPPTSCSWAASSSPWPSNIPDFINVWLSRSWSSSGPLRSSSCSVSWSRLVSLTGWGRFHKHKNQHNCTLTVFGKIFLSYGSTLNFIASYKK